MVSNQQKLIVIFGLKKEYDIFSPTKNFRKSYGFGKKALESLKKFNLSEIDTVINIGYCGAIDSSVKSGDIIKIKANFLQKLFCHQKLWTKSEKCRFCFFLVLPCSPRRIPNRFFGNSSYLRVGAK